LRPSDSVRLQVPISQELAEEIVCSSIRVLGLDGRYAGSGKAGSPNVPRALRRYLEAVAQHNKLHSENLVQAIREALLGNAIIDHDWCIRSDRPSIPLSLELVDTHGLAWRCGVCARVHLHHSGGICTNSACCRPALQREAF